MLTLQPSTRKQLLKVRGQMPKMLVLTNYTRCSLICLKIGDINLELLVIVLSIAAINISLIAWLRADMKAFEQRMDLWREEIREDRRDFHGRLASIEARWHEEKYRKN